MVLEPLGENITNYGASSLGGDMVTQLGATLANPDASTVGKEDIIAANPDVIFVFTQSCSARCMQVQHVPRMESKPLQRAYIQTQQLTK